MATQQHTRWPAGLHALRGVWPHHRPVITPARLALSALVLASAVVGTMLAGDWLAHTPLGFLYAAVAWVAALTGVTVAIGATVAALVLAELLLFDPRAALPLTSEVIVRDGLFVGVSLLLILAVHRLQDARSRADVRQRESLRFNEQLRERALTLELQVSEAEALTRELEHVNRQLAAQTEAAERAAIRAERLHQFTTLLLDQTGEAAVASAIVEQGSRALDAAAAVVVRTSEIDGVDVLASRGDPCGVFGDPHEFCRSSSPVFRAVTTGDAVWIRDSAELSREYAQLTRWVGGHRAWAALPLQVEQRRLGCLALAFDREPDFSAEDRSFMLLVAQQCAQALDRARSYDLQRKARVRAEFAERRLAFLADASERLASSLDFINSLANLAEFAVPEFADWCLIHLAGDNDAPLLVAAAHPDTARLERRRAMDQTYPPARTAPVGIGRVLRTGEADCVVVTDDVARSVARDATHLELLRSLHVREQLTVPIPAEGRTLGTLTFAISESSRTFDEADVTLAEELGIRAGQAIQNARLYQEAHHASEAKSNFLAVISHELRTPLNAIIGYSDLLVLGVPNSIPEKALHQVERIRIAAAALLALVEEVLSFSRIEAGKEEIRISPVELSGLARECLALVEPMAVQKALEVRLALPEEPVKIVSDERKIRQILTNLLSNAVKFTEHGMVSLAVRPGAGEVQLVVADTGIGISQQNLERIFVPFWQVEPASTRRFGGTGLGLGVARKLARLLEGRLEVVSEEGKGSTFTLTLPIRVQHAARTP